MGYNAGFRDGMKIGSFPVRSKADFVRWFFLRKILRGAKSRQQDHLLTAFHILSASSTAHSPVVTEGSRDWVDIS